ncbi:MAG: hypothetical protein H7Y59_11470 [Anaerolineales bacterium]|nr:hypothetical protein [Anaerolineales bacterium]
MSQPNDDLEAVRILVTALENFEKSDQERIIRWAREKLGLEIQSVNSMQFLPQSQGSNAADTQQTQPGSVIDLKSFVNTKKPTSDMQFAATVAYYYKFEAPSNERKEAISSEILQDATRLAPRERLKDPNQTLRNAATNGLLDKAGERGAYKINTVGENLVAMTLPQSNVTAKKSKSTSKPTKNVSKRKK